MRPPWIWFDLENTPHVLLLEPIMTALASAGWTLGITAKPQSQTDELARARGIHVDVVGSGNFAGLPSKLMGGLTRAALLARWVRRRGRPRLLVSSSRSASLTAAMLRIPAVALLDYEHAHHAVFGLACRSLWMPDLLRGQPLAHPARAVARYFPGLKENLYLDAWEFDRAAQRRALGAIEGSRLVAARPPATTAHYAPRDGLARWLTTVRELAHDRCADVIVTPRSSRQRDELAGALEATPRVRFLERVTPGPGLVAAADLVVGGGGTMNREAAVLGVPVWSVFTGPTPHIDRCLADEGRLRWIRSDADLRHALAEPWPARRERRGPYPAGLLAILADVRDQLN